MESWRGEDTVKKSHFQFIFNSFSIHFQFIFILSLLSLEVRVESQELIWSGRRLLPSETVEDVGLRHGDVMTALVKPQLVTTDRAFALRRGGVVTWGDVEMGGDCSGIQDRLREVCHLVACGHAFAGLLPDGSVATWGKPEFGGDSKLVEAELRHVIQIEASSSAFAARLSDGSVVTWGNPACGGDSTAVRDRLKTVQDIKATAGAFAARLADGSVVTWGNSWCGGDSERVKLKDVKQIKATKYAFAALMAGSQAAFCVDVQQLR